MQAGRCGARDCSYTGGLVRKSYGHRDLEGAVRQRRQLRVTRPHQLFYHWASGGMYVPRAGLLNIKLGVIDAARASPLGNLFRPENLANYTRG